MSGGGAEDLCFCTLALGGRYREMARAAADGLKKFFPGVELVILTDSPGYFSGCGNVRAYRHRQTGILHPYQDKRFAIQKALSLHGTVIFMDADTGIKRKPFRDARFDPGITTISEDLVEHIEKTVPSRLPRVRGLCGKLGLDPRDCKWSGEALVVVKKNGGKERKFLDIWDRAGRYLQIHGIVSGVGIPMGVAAAAAGLKIHSGAHYEELRSCMDHVDASNQRPGLSTARLWKKRIGYHYRLNRERLKALSDPCFYYL
ncbi:MAG: hypothetical protein GF392_05420 [Candidatus Omnitrophica bacterium]|nr:hypothetical protein [Candidatus Omnitrophota bacterium]